MFHHYDPLPQTDDVTRTVAVNECGNCGKACETLHDLPRWNFQACDACAEEAARADEKETREVREFLIADGWTPFEKGLSQDDGYIDLSRDFGFTWELKYFDGKAGASRSKAIRSTNSKSLWDSLLTARTATSKSIPTNSANARNCAPYALGRLRANSG